MTPRVKFPRLSFPILIGVALAVAAAMHLGYDAWIALDFDDAEIILCSQWPDKVGKGMLFIELTADDWKALPAMLEGAGVVSRWGWWGYRTLIVADPDGNELYFPDPEDPGGGPA